MSEETLGKRRAQQKESPSIVVRAGKPVQKTGDYMLVDPRNNGSAHVTVTLLQGMKAPPTPKKGQVWKLS